MRSLLCHAQRAPLVRRPTETRRRERPSGAKGRRARRAVHYGYDSLESSRIHPPSLSMETLNKQPPKVSISSLCYQLGRRRSGTVTTGSTPSHKPRSSPRRDRACSGTSASSGTSKPHRSKAAHHESPSARALASRARLGWRNDPRALRRRRGAMGCVGNLATELCRATGPYRPARASPECRPLQQVVTKAEGRTSRSVQASAVSLLSRGQRVVDGPATIDVLSGLLEEVSSRKPKGWSKQPSWVKMRRSRLPSGGACGRGLLHHVASFCVSHLPFRQLIDCGHSLAKVEL